jgi:hypothetical protein
MSSAGTLISDLDGKAPTGGDDDLVRQIMADINTGGGGGGNMAMPPQQPSMGVGPPPPQMNSYKIQQPNANTIYNQAVDPAVPTAHMIGSQHPNPADFATMMMANGQGTPYISHQQQQYLQALPQQQMLQKNGPSWKATLFEQLRQPLLVTIIVFVLSLPAVNILLQHYAPTLLRTGGDLNNLGLIVRASLAGGLFWLFQNVVGPLIAQ